MSKGTDALFSIPLKTLEGEDFDAKHLKNKVTLVTNVACEW